MKPTLPQVFALSLLGLLAALALLFSQVVAATRRTLEESSDRLRAAVSERIGERVTRFLAKGPAAAQQVQLALNRGLVDPRDPVALEAALLAPLLADPDLGEITLTYGRQTGFGPAGAIELAPEPRGQLSVVRSFDAAGGELLWSRRVHAESGTFVADRRSFGPVEHFAAQPLQREAGMPLPDPTLHPTFTTPARETFYGRLLWSDLAQSQLDADLPEAQRRVEVSVQQVMTDAGAKFAGVLRVGLLARQLDRAVQLDAAADPHLIVLCDAAGRLVTRGVATDRLMEIDDDLRIDPAALPPEISAALADPALRRSAASGRAGSSQMRVRGEDFLTTFHPLPPGQTQDWIVGVIVPRAFYLGPLAAVRQRLLLMSAGIIVVLVGGGGLILRSVRRAQAQITAEAGKMNAFDFTPVAPVAPFRDVAAVLESLERAKTAMRAMSKYVPVDLVRRLYREKSEPVPGGTATELSLMFTDIEGFTSITETLPAAQLAAALERYLDALAPIIQRETRGTIDKYIGDAIMTFWNAPEPVPEHARMACRAALRCRAAGDALAATEAWRGLPPFKTRFGLHCGTALVGHFGATDRLNYTAIGDAVNLASRLEGLNKLYGTTIIASEAIATAAGEAFVFRLLDIVAVKGKQHAVRIYELLGEQGTARPAEAETYERAFALYLARDFSAASALLAPLTDDPPSRLLLARCRDFLHTPPGPAWNGTHIAEEK